MFFGNESFIRKITHKAVKNKKIANTFENVCWNLRNIESNYLKRIAS